MNTEVIAGAEPTFVSGTSAGVLLLHDLAGTPQIFEFLIDALSEAGFSVDVPLLPGHGTSVDELEKTNWDDWAAAAQLALDELASRTGPVVVIGIATGAALGCLVASDHPSVAGVIAINPLVMPVPREALVTLQELIANGVDQISPLDNDGLRSGGVDVLRYSTLPTAAILSLCTALNQMSIHWRQLNVPMLIVSSARDQRVAPENAQWLAERVSGHVDRMLLEESTHDAPLDKEHVRLEREIIEFVRGVSATLPE